MKNNNRTITGNIDSDTIIEINGKKLDGDNIYFNEDYVAVDGIKRDDIEMKDFKFQVYNQSERKEEDNKGIDVYLLILHAITVFTFIAMMTLLSSKDNSSPMTNTITIENKLGSCEVTTELDSHDVTYDCVANEAGDINFSMIVDTSNPDVDYNIDSSCEFTEGVDGLVSSIACDDFSIKIKKNL